MFIFRGQHSCTTFIHASSANTDIVLAVLGERGLVLLAVEHQRDLLVCIVVHELLVQFLGADDVLFDIRALLVGGPIRWRIDIDLCLLEVLLVQFFQWDGADWRIRILLLERSVRDQGRNVFLQLRQV